jgi:signal peptidase
VRYRTKGDANDVEDGTLVHPNNIIGSPVFCIPKLGYVASYISRPPGTYVAVAGAALFLALMFIPDLFAEDEEDPKPKKRKKEDAEETV